VIAVIELEEGWTPGPELTAEVDAHCRAGLASLKCPRRYEFRAALPRTPSGKLLRRVLREELRAGASAQGSES
jgi:long-chain acyl-CoA synthetase